MSYPPQQPAYTAEAVEQVRQQRIQGVKRRYNISLGFQIVFTAIFAGLLGYYISRNQKYSNKTYYYYSSGSWFSWYIGLLIALLVVDLMCIAFTIRQKKKALDWLNDPSTPPHLIMMGFNPQSDYNEVVVVQHTAPVYTQPPPAQNYYQPPPPTYAPPPANPPQSPPGPYGAPPPQGQYGNDRNHLEKPLS
ncbi:hypothetical protein GGI12_000466 [Dipsacomyces acuminosporus]|nr:hypothetical protein GGI12_000466 [Dipsacomyces acuminosporus]